MSNPQAALTSTISALAEKIRRYRDKDIGEQNTKASLIEPLLERLGWEIRDLDSVHREYRTKTRDKPVDYALKLLRRPRLFIEAKGLGENLAERKWIAQVLGYATVAGVEWCVLTDGNEYRIYNATAAVDAEEKLFRKVRIADDDAAITTGTLHLISRSNLEENLLDVHWRTHFVDRRVKAAITELVESAHPGMIRLIRKKVPSLKAKSITESLARLEVRVDAAPLPVVPERPRGAASGAGGMHAAEKRRQSDAGKSRTRRGEGGRAHARVTLLQVIEAGFLKTPLPLFRRYKGQMLQARLMPDGKCLFAGTPYDSPSRAADYARSTITGRPMNTNGWIFWRYDDDGVTRKLEFARKRFLSQSPDLRVAQ